MQSFLVVCFCLEIVIKWIFDLLGWETNGKEPGKVKGKDSEGHPIIHTCKLWKRERQREEKNPTNIISKVFKILSNN